MRFTALALVALVLAPVVQATLPVPDAPVPPALWRTGADARAPCAAPVCLVRASAPVDAALVHALTAHGARVHAFVPERALVASVPEDARAAVAALPGVAGVTAVPAHARVDPALALAPGETARVSVLAVDARAPVDRVVDAAGLRALAEDARVLWVERAPGGFEGDMGNVRAFTGAARAHARHVTGAGTVLGVIDDGLDAAHPALAPALLGVDGGNAPVAAHGTATFGIALATDAGNATGMALGAKGVFASWQSGRSRYVIAESLAANWSAHVVLTPYGARNASADATYGAASAETDRIVRDLSVLVVQSLGNCGPGCARREAMAKNAVTVGGVFHEDTAPRRDDAWRAPASTGPAADGRLKPDVAGPFDAVHTTAPGGAFTVDFGGTSAASAVIAGAAVLVRDALVHGRVGPAHPTPSPALVKSVLLASARAYAPHQVLDASARDDPWGRAAQGWGVPDVTRVLDTTPLLVEDAPRGVATGDAAEWTVRVPAGATRVDVTLAWSDAPAHPAAARALVNDLDLEVRDPTGALAFHGNAGLRDGAWSVPGGAPDRVDNVERVRVPAPAPGAWTITVRGAHVPVGDAQPFALVAFAWA